MRFRHTLRAWPLIVVASVSACGLGRVDYRTYDFADHPDAVRLAEGEAQITRGRPWRVGDAVGHYVFSLPGKILLLNWDLASHDVSPETEAALAEYLERNNLRSVKVRLNEYEPRQEWRRLVNNREVGWFWRYTVGVVSWLNYTIFPERIFAGFPIIGGGDHYNPYTNTIHIYSDDVSIALHEGAHAKDTARKEGWKGTYGALRILPLVPLYQEYVASDDAVDYLRAFATPADERSAYRVLYPAYGTYVADETRWFGYEGYPIFLGAVVVGHVSGNVRALFVPDARTGTESESTDGRED